MMSSLSCREAENTFGPAVDNQCDRFDFTLLFEDTILIIAPAIIFLLLLILRISYLQRGTKKNPTDLLQIFRLPNHGLGLLSSLIVAFKLPTLILGEIQPKPAHGSYSPEERSGILSRAFFWWVNPLFFKGTLGMDDLFALDTYLTTEYLSKRLQKAWTNKKNRRPSLLRSLIWELKWPLLTTEWFDQPKTEDTRNIGYGLLGAFTLVYVGLAIATTLSQHRVYRFVTMVRGSLVSMIYHQTLNLSTVDLEGSAALTLMSTDIERIDGGLAFIHETWAGLIVVALAIWLLEIQLGWGCIGPIVVTISMS
ncbi:hypothetical protein B7463_g8829, partial [Scytalidium lignicola]